MNISNNQRFRETDQKIRQCMLSLLQSKPIEKITVGELCRLSGCNRSTFYAHFLDVYDLLDKIQIQIYQDMKAHFESADVQKYEAISPQLLSIMLTHIQESKMFYRAYFSCGRAALDHPENRLYDYFIRPYFTKIGFDFNNDSDSRKAWYHFRFFFDGMISVIRQWLNAGCPESPQELSGIIWASIAPVPDRIPPFSFEEP